MTYVQIVCCIIYYNTMTAKPNSSMVHQLAPPPLCSYATVSDWRIQCSNLDERTTDWKVLKILQNQDRSILYPVRPKLIGKKDEIHEKKYLKLKKKHHSKKCHVCRENQCGSFLMKCSEKNWIVRFLAWTKEHIFMFLGLDWLNPSNIVIIGNKCVIQNHLWQWNSFFRYLYMVFSGGELLGCLSFPRNAELRIWSKSLLNISPFAIGMAFTFWHYYLQEMYTTVCIYRLNPLCFHFERTLHITVFYCKKIHLPNKRCCLFYMKLLYHTTAMSWNSLPH